MKVETDIIINIAACLIGQTVILGIIYDDHDERRNLCRRTERHHLYTIIKHFQLAKTRIALKK